MGRRFHAPRVMGRECWSQPRQGSGLRCRSREQRSSEIVHSLEMALVGHRLAPVQHARDLTSRLSYVGSSSKVLLFTFSSGRMDRWTDEEFDM